MPVEALSGLSHVRERREGFSDPGSLGSGRRWVGDVRHQGVGRDTAEPAGLEVLDGLPDLGAGVHYERPVVLYVLADGFAAEK